MESTWRWCALTHRRVLTGSPSLQYLAHAEYPYPKAKFADAVLAAMNSTKASVADLARLNFLLAELYADALLATQRRFHLKAELVGCHGQTLYHQGEALSFLGRKLAVTWQTGEGAVLAARLGVPVVSDFRPADMAAGGKGAPLVPFLDFLFIVIPGWDELCRTSAESQTSPRSRRDRRPIGYWRSIPARATW